MESSLSEIKIPSPQHNSRTVEFPIIVLSMIFKRMEPIDVFKSMRVCKAFFHTLKNPHSAIWKQLIANHVPPGAVLDPKLFPVEMSPYHKLVAFETAWNPKDCSENVIVEENGFTMRRNMMAQSTDGIRGKVGFKAGIHAFEFTWGCFYGSNATIGFTTKNAALQVHGYQSLIGSNSQSWGLDIANNILLHNGRVYGHYPAISAPYVFEPGEPIKMILNLDDHNCYFEHRGQFLGYAFSDLPLEKFFPAAAAVSGDASVSMIYLGRP